MLSARQAEGSLMNRVALRTAVALPQQVSVDQGTATAKALCAGFQRKRAAIQATANSCVAVSQRAFALTQADPNRYQEVPPSQYIQGVDY
jgi:hypothetical protein